MEDKTPHIGTDNSPDLPQVDDQNRQQIKFNEVEWDAIVLKSEDHVATALRHLAAGEPARINMNGKEFVVHVLEEIPLCHKLAITTIDTGEIILKFGYEIGRATSRIPVGHHVHVHNLSSMRAKSKTASQAP